ncbi:MATE family efflux transporter [Paenactinomyces guangxiensis]|uniref:Probable multidrug resistance protein NorM n=1 Tax=Paenactinomyces guangxiensis TaxID=1490290 RepID=A0A7W1WU73_9BACL|nr:MATE family efflux transporter [Paenactinomyces guangxiensis]MBA4496109.1 MATE family efflux transporter [Paenactinomyces guangxiensis]MBH8593197.1 MATE family efflux transporter [Paenactinomyces guangxiensis]
MHQTYSLREKTRQFFVILLPILVTQLGLYAMSFFDTIMSGHAGSHDLAGVAIGVSIWTPVFTGLSGILLALTPIVSQLTGARRNHEVPFKVIQAVYLALAIAIAVILCGALALNPILDRMGLDHQVRQIASQFLIALSFGIIPLFVYNVIRCFIDALGQTRVTMMITLISLPINVLLNYLLIFGKFGFPRLGGVGAGYASAITYWCIMLIAIYVVVRRKPFSDYQVFQQFYRISFAAWKEQLKIGAPIGFAIFFETSIFSAVTLLMSQFNTATIAAHQAAMNFASFLYMVPISISMAITIAVAFEVGAKRYDDAAKYSYLGIGIAVMMGLFCAVGLFIFNEQVAYMYTADQEVLQLTKQFLLYAILFQLSDAVAAPIQGALRGYKDVNATFMMAFVSYWVLGLPTGYILANVTPYGAFGYWIGLIAGLAFGAVFLSGRLARIQRRHKSRTGLTSQL